MPHQRVIARSRYKDVIGPLMQEYTEGKSGPTAKAKWTVNGLNGPAEYILPIAATASGIPRFGNPYPGLPNMLVTKVSAVLAEGSNRIATVSVEWG